MTPHLIVLQFIRSSNIKVHQVVFKETNEVLAMKSLKKKHLIETNSVDNTKAEKDILRKVITTPSVIYVSNSFFVQIRHPFIVKLHYAFQSDSKLHLIMDFVNGYVQVNDAQI